MRARLIVQRALLATGAPLLVVEIVLQLGAAFIAVTRAPPTPASNEPCAVLCVGDSFTYGLGASDPANSYPARLDQRLRTQPIEGQSRVVNGGWPGRNSRNVLECLARQLEEVNPKFVAVMVGINDVWSRPPRFELARAGTAAVPPSFRLELRLPRLCRLIFSNPTTLEDLAGEAADVGVVAGAVDRALPRSEPPKSTPRQKLERSLTAQWQAGDAFLELQAGGGCEWEDRRWTWEFDERDLVLTPLAERGAPLRPEYRLDRNQLELQFPGGATRLVLTRVAPTPAMSADAIAEGRKAIARKDDASAIEIFSRAIEEHPDQMRLRSLRIDAAARLRRQDMIDEDLAALRSTLAAHLDPTNAESLVSGLVSAGRVDEVRSVLAEELRHFPRSAALWSTQASVAENAGDVALAEESISRALDLQPEAELQTLIWRLRFRAKLLGRRSAFDEAAIDVLRAFLVDGDPDRLRQAICPMAAGFTPERLESAAVAVALPTRHLELAREIRAEAVDPMGGNVLAVLADHLRVLVHYCRARGSEPVILSYPFASEELQRVQAEIADEVACRFVDLAPKFEELLAGHAHSDYFVPDNHCNDAGYAVIAEAVEAALRVGL